MSRQKTDDDTNNAERTRTIRVSGTPVQVTREIYETYLWKVCDHAVRTYIEQAFANTPLSQGDREILIRYHKCEGFGQIIDWLNHGMRTDIMADFRRICELRRGTAAELLDKLR